MPPNLQHLRETIRGRTQTAVGRAAQPFQDLLRRTSPYDTGQMVNRTTVRPAGPRRLDIRVATDYASYVREGTAPHVIRPRNRQFLAFFWDKAPPHMRTLPDGRVLAKKVNHPGTDPNSWYDDALGKLTELVNEELSRI